MENPTNQQPNEATAQEQAPAQSGTGSDPQTVSLIDRADSVAKRMEEANKRAEELIKRQEMVLSRSILGGKTEAGTVTKTQEQIDAEKIDAMAKAAVERFYGKR